LPMTFSTSPGDFEIEMTWLELTCVISYKPKERNSFCVSLEMFKESPAYLQKMKYLVCILHTSENSNYLCTGGSD